MITARRASRVTPSAGTGAAAPADAAAPPSSASGPTLLDLLLNATDSEEGGSAGGAASGLSLTDEELLDNAVTFLFAGVQRTRGSCPRCTQPHSLASFPAGHETTSQALTYAMYLLAKHPDWQVRERDKTVPSVLLLPRLVPVRSPIVHAAMYAYLNVPVPLRTAPLRPLRPAGPRTGRGAGCAQEQRGRGGCSSFAPPYHVHHL